MAMLMRAQLARPQNPFLGPEVYNQLFTLHGTVMMFLFAIPLIEGVALYLLPKLLGARDLAYPRLSAFGYWCYLFGGVAILASFVFGVAPDGGWFMYVPLASKAYSPGINADVWLLGVTFVEVSAICAAVEFVVTVLKVRTGGMALHRMPLMAWYLLITAAMMLVGFPPLILGSVLLEIERAFGWPFFAPDAGGAPLLWQHLFWLFGHPEVYIIFLPAAGVVSTLIPVFARTRIVGYAWIVAAIIALAFLSFGLWVHHMFTTGIPHLALAFFSAASTLVAIPTAVQIFAWTATLLKGRPRLSLPMLYLLGFFSVFIFGGLTGVMLAIVPFDWQVHDTHFVVAHLHYVLIGGFVFPMLAAVYYWLPLMTGRLPVFSVSRTAF
uniref:cbb3-type cytochrome c oxidase subunit I n=1 Tax=Marinicauda pacifica TaxID=1133559 RepID=UPI0035C86F05